MTAVAPFGWAVAKDAIYDWLAAATGLPVVWANQDAPRPPYPYATLNIIAGPVPVGVDELRIVQDGSNTYEVPTGSRRITVSCQAFVSFEGVTWDHATDAMARMSAAQMDLARSSVHEQLRAVGVHVQDVLELRDLTGAIEAGTLSRAAFDIICGLAFRAVPATVVPVIETVKVSSDLSGQTGTGDVDLDDETFP